MLGIGAIPSVILAVGVLAMPESPRWLVMKGRLGDATKVLNKTSDSEQEAQLRLMEIKAAAGIPENCNDDVVTVNRTNEREGSTVWKELFLYPTPAVRHIVIAALGIHFFQQASGIDAVVLYSPTIFRKKNATYSEDFYHESIANDVAPFIRFIFVHLPTKIFLSLKLIWLFSFSVTLQFSNYFFKQFGNLIITN
jgi:hypothetical protein